MAAAPTRAPAARAPAKSRRLVKAGVALVAIAVFGFLFIRSLRQSRTTPYTVERGQLAGWTLALEPTGPPTAPMLMLRAPSGFAGGLFDQVFKRAMESLRSPSEAGIPLVLHGEFGRALASHLTPQALMAAARAAGLEGVAVAPRCLGHRRSVDTNATRQVHFVLFDMPAFARFRQQVLALAGDASGFHPETLSPVMLLAGTDAFFDDWLPLRADPSTDCVSPIVSE